MAPIKFEENIKDKLENRRLQPSANAWDKLSNQLETNEKKNNKNTYWWYGVAASIVGVLFIVSQFVNSRAAETIKNQVVENPETIEKQDIIKEVEAEKPMTKPQQKSVPIVVSRKGEDTEAFIEKPISKQKIVPVEKEKSIVIVQNKERFQEAEIIIEPIKIVKEVLTFEEQKIQQVVAQVQELKENKSQITAAEIEALLQQAQQEIALKKLYNKSTRIVDANALLQDVEADLARSFRTKVFEALKASYSTVKTAIATRNN